MKNFLSAVLVTLLFVSFSVPAFAMLPDKLSQSEFGALASQIKRCEEDLADLGKKKPSGKSGQRKNEKRKEALSRKLKNLKDEYKKQLDKKRNEILADNKTLKEKIKRGGRNKPVWEHSLAANDKDLLRLKAFSFMVDYEEGMDFAKLAAPKPKQAPPAKK